MSNTHLNATHIFVTTAPAVGVDHDGKPYTNPDVPVGTALAQDSKGLWFMYIVHMQGLDDPACWPSPSHLYRDSWRHITPSPGAPYYDAIVNCPKKCVRCVSDTVPTSALA